MPSPVELAVTSLLPTTNTLPQELIDLSTAFVAQSQARASSLKPEEEIGRTYACCHVACQRLGKKFSLEIGKPMPPVNPRVYTKLHTYLNSVLRAPTTPRARRVEDKVGKDGRSGSQSAAITPSSRRAATAATTTTPSRRSIVTAASEPGRLEVPPADGDGLPTESHDAVTKAQNEDEPDDEGLMSTKRPAKTPLRRKEKHAKRVADGEEEEPGAAGLLPGLGTMFQSSIDWLSDERRAEFAMWKQGAMKEIRMIEQKG